MVEEESVRVVRCGGSELNFRRAVFSADSKYGATADCQRAEGRESPGRERKELSGPSGLAYRGFWAEGKGRVQESLGHASGTCCLSAA